MNLSPPKGTLWGKVQPFWCFLCQTLAEFHPPPFGGNSNSLSESLSQEKKFFSFLFFYFFLREGFRKRVDISSKRGGETLLKFDTKNTSGGCTFPERVVGFLR